MNSGAIVMIMLAAAIALAMMFINIKPGKK